MSLLVKGGITNLSELIIDAAPAKAKDILDLILTTQGDLLMRGIIESQRLGGNFGFGYNFLHIQNTGQFIPEWVDLMDLIIYLTGAVNRAVALPILCIPAPTLSLVVAEDHSGGSTPIAPDALAIPLPTVDKAAAATSVNAVGGAVAHDEDGADTDETTEANEATADDMTLLQADGALLDWYAIGYASLFDGIVLNVSTVGADITLDTFEYSKGGGSWGTLTPILNPLNNYETAGKLWFTFERPGDWAVDTYAGIADKYWIKFKSSATGGGYTQPLGAQAWILVY